MKFAYSGQEVDPLPGEVGLQRIFVPTVVVRVAGPKAAYLIEGLVDTGAQVSLIPAHYLEKLGVPKGTRFNLTGASGASFPAWIGRVDLELNWLKKPCRWSAQVGFTPGRRLAIWGHDGFLDHFTATFNGARRCLTLRPNPNLPPPVHGD